MNNGFIESIEIQGSVSSLRVGLQGHRGGFQEKRVHVDVRVQRLFVSCNSLQHIRSDGKGTR